MHDVADLRGKHVVFLSWRDTRHPEGGGAEKYLEMVANGLVELGARSRSSAPPTRRLRRTRPSRASGSSVAAAGSGSTCAGCSRCCRGSLGAVDVVVDVLNGLPFWSRLVTRAPVVVLVHHVHREQWPVAVPGRLSSVGWWLESRAAPRVYRSDQYVAVSQATRARAARPRRARAPDRGRAQRLGAIRPRHRRQGRGADLAVVGRLVPHKQVEQAIDTALALREEFPGLTLHVVGAGWWEGVLHEYAGTREAGGTVVFEGHVDERRKHEIYERAWVLLLPSIKEGWGLVIPEAGMHATPAIAYRSAGGDPGVGRRRACRDCWSRTRRELVEATRRLLADRVLRERLGDGARERCRIFTWEHAQTSFAVVLLAAMDGSAG